MIEAFNRYYKQGWDISINNHGQAVFTEPDGIKYFALGGVTKKEADHLEMLKINGYGVGLRKRFAHRRE